MSKKSSELFNDEVTTGAELASGTTVGGNGVHLLGNDGSGSGLDVETIYNGQPAVRSTTYTKDIQDNGSVILVE